MKKILKTVSNVLSFTIVSVMILILIANLYLLIAREVMGNRNATFLGFTSAVVLTGSMEETISPNDMVIVHTQKDYKVDDIVMYSTDSSTVTHRIIELKENGYITKGDANNTDDGTIPNERIIGKVVLIVPKVGVTISFLLSPLGMLLLLIVLILMIELPLLIRSRKK